MKRLDEYFEGEFFQPWLEKSRRSFQTKILSKLEVRPPYFALEDLSLYDEETLRAIVIPEQPLEMEVGPITAGEVGRHLAILGSCALAAKNPKEGLFFYLAKKANFLNHSSGKAFGKLHAFAKGEFTGKREAVAHAEMYDQAGNHLHTLKLEYHVMSEKVFNRMFSKEQINLRSNDREQKTFYGRNNPYAVRFPLKNIEFADEALTASIGRVTPQMCNGHFPQYPTLPIAFIARLMINAAGELLKKRLDQESIKFRVTEVSISSEHLAFTGEEVFLEVKPLAVRQYHSFWCRTYTAYGESIGEAIIDIELAETS